MDFLRELRERLLTDALENLGLVAEIEVNGAGRILDPFGDLPYGDVFVTLFDEESSGGIQDLLPDALFLPCSPFLNSHTEQCSVYSGGRPLVKSCFQKQHCLGEP